jgi:hypothetical protein
MIKNPYVNPYASNTNCLTLTPTHTAAVYSRCNGDKRLPVLLSKLHPRKDAKGMN